MSTRRDSPQHGSCCIPGERARGVHIDGDMHVSLSCPGRTPALRPLASPPRRLLSLALPRPQAAPDSTEKATAGGAAPAPDGSKKPEPFAFADFTWLTGNPRTTSSPLDTPVFTFEFRVDTSFHYDFHHPADNTISGSSEVFRSG